MVELIVLLHAQHLLRLLLLRRHGNVHANNLPHPVLVREQNVHTETLGGVDGQQGNNPLGYCNVHPDHGAEHSIKSDSKLYFIMHRSSC